jgi:hypothetical protein
MTRKDWFEVIAVAIAGYPAMKALDWVFGEPWWCWWGSLTAAIGQRLQDCVRGQQMT